MVALIQNKAWNFTKYKPLNLLMVHFLFSGWNLNTIVQEKNAIQMDVVWTILEIEGVLNI